MLTAIWGNLVTATGDRQRGAFTAAIGEISLTLDIQRTTLMRRRALVHPRARTSNALRHAER